MKNFAVIVAAGALASVVSAQVVDVDLGTLGIGSSTNLVGTTVGGQNAFNSYVNSSGTTVGFSASLSEVIYQFTLSSNSVVNLINNEGLFVGSDTDHYFLNSLTPFAPSVGEAFAFIDEQGSIGLFAGTYFLSLDTFSGGTNVEGDFDITLDIAAIVAPTAIDLGIVADEGEAFSIDTFGSSFDTELGLYDGLGTLLANNDDAGGLQSEVVVSGLDAGTYYFAVGGFNTGFSNGFTVSPGSSNGTIAGQANGVAFSGAIGSGQVQWYSFTVIPTPSSLALLGLGGLAVARRRR